MMWSSSRTARSRSTREHEMTALAGDDRLRRDVDQPQYRREQGSRDRQHLLMIGVEPNTEWLDSCLQLDAKRFIKTGAAEDGTPTARLSFEA